VVGEGEGRKGRIIIPIGVKRKRDTYLCLQDSKQLIYFRRKKAE